MIPVWAAMLKIVFIVSLIVLFTDTILAFPFTFTHIKYEYKSLILKVLAMILLSWMILLP